MTTVCIAGMHRSGTSLFARALSFCGLYLGEETDMAPAAPDNAEGYWENVHILSLNDRILQRLGGGWDLPPKVSPGWEEFPEIVLFRAEARACLKRLTRPPHWGWKDPRTSLTMPFWRQLVPNLKVVLCVRDPLDVARSLERRGSASMAFSVQLWSTYYARVLESVPAEDRIVTHYDAFVSDGRRELQRLLGFLGISANPAMLEQACAAINPNLRHHRARVDQAERPVLESEVRDAYDRLCEEAGPIFAAAARAEMISRAELQPTAEGETSQANHNVEGRLLEELRGRVWQSAFTIRGLEDTVEARSKHVEALIRETEELTATLRMTEAQLLELQSSLAVKLLRRYRMLLERTLPEGTGRRRAYDRVVRAVRQLLFEGPVSMFRTVRQRLSERSSRVSTRDRGSILPGVAAGARSRMPHYGREMYAQAFKEAMSTASGTPSQDYVPLSDENLDSGALSVRAIAFYLPQFHPIPENDEWWGKGFTEWSNVAKAVPQFVGHYQPKLPGELGFYDLRVPEVQARQVELARKHGIYGFAFHYYWFNGKRLLERPLENFIANEDLNFPFCVCWANENWTRRWDGQESDILIAQAHSPESDLRFIGDISPLLKDKRYIRVDDRPLLIVYRPNVLPEASQTVRLWRDHCEKAGIGNPYLVAAQTFGFVDPREYGFDAAVEFPPHTTLPLAHLSRDLEFLNPRFSGAVVDYSDFVERSLLETEPPYKLFKTVFPGWDNEARKPGRGFVFASSTPDQYRRWLSGACAWTLRHEQDADRRLVFINAWNEWGEGAYLEPDRRFGYAYLEATMTALGETAADPSRPQLGGSKARQIDPVIVYQMGKVGSMSVVDSLKRTYAERQLPVKVHHVHSLNKLDHIARAAKARPNPAETLSAIEGYKVLRAEIDADSHRRWKVITLIREPVGRNVAWFFQNLHELLPDWESRLQEDSLRVEELQELFLESPQVKHATPEQWFQNQLEPVFGVDVFAEPFTMERGYKIYSQTPRASLLLIRLENLSDCAQMAMREFLGLEGFLLTNSNVADDKPYAPLYRTFKARPLPRTYLEEMYATRFARHFYSPQEIDNFLAKWIAPSDA